MATRHISSLCQMSDYCDKAFAEYVWATVPNGAITPSQVAQSITIRGLMMIDGQQTPLPEVKWPHPAIGPAHAALLDAGDAKTSLHFCGAHRCHANL